MAQYGFYFDQTACIGCHTCQIACKDKNRLDIGYLFRNVKTYEVGEFPNPAIYHVAESCNHCTNPACVAACPTKRTVQDPETGIVYHDPVFLGIGRHTGAAGNGNRFLCLAVPCDGPAVESVQQIAQWHICNALFQIGSAGQMITIHLHRNDSDSIRGQREGGCCQQSAEKPASGFADPSKEVRQSGGGG